ncbi:NAD(P)-dependent oxidoreductase [Aquabacterium sp.]|uniref:NAD(P)-dependent oxidoreductase n=1 Tax=Aquabacterium sp. TaxID=1872578 RepID=UPI002CD4D8CB|nr:NAD(P)-dependent oxidoreductase [Aquabacterium sp.]HSW07218.1 NAD(P)-dependent oxidoreductase [Aquabacterium sp.]
MKIALIGATGFVGSALLDELLQRGHQVTALVRDPAKLVARDGLRTATADVYDATQVAQAVEGHEVVLSAFNPGWTDPQLHDRFLAGSRAIVAAAQKAHVARLVVIGGAGSLYVAPGVQLVDTPAFLDHVPPNIVPGAQAARQALNELRQETVLNWTFVSPPAMLQPGQRSGAYRLGQDQLLMNGDQPAGISVQDLAVAVVDELETPKHPRQRFTVAN